MFFSNLIFRYFKLTSRRISIGNELTSSASLTLNGFLLRSRYSRLCKSEISAGIVRKLFELRISLRSVVSRNFKRTLECQLNELIKKFKKKSKWSYFERLLSWVVSNPGLTYHPFLISSNKLIKSFHYLIILMWHYKVLLGGRKYWQFWF